MDGADYYRRLPKRLLSAYPSHRVFEILAKHISEQVESPPYTVDLARLAQMPREVQTTYWLWRFVCEAGIAGMDVFILNSLGIYSSNIHAALIAIGAKELVANLEAAVAFARDAHAEFTRLASQEWFDQFSSYGPFNSLQSINRPTFALIDGLRDAVATFIQQNEGKLFID
jgi:hypothetical protein